MENSECTLLSRVKVEDEENEMKEEASNENADLEFMPVEDSMSVGEASSEHDMLEIGDSVNAYVSFSEGEIGQCDRSFNFSKIDAGTRRRLRFSESDDMVLLRKVATLNPYKCSSMWKEVTQVVAMRAGKNFSVRSIRDHTDLLMNTFSLRGVDACLKRTPPDLWDKKKRLLHLVHSLWKRDSHSLRGTASNAIAANKSGADSTDLAKLQSRLCRTARVESPSIVNSPSKNNDSHLPTSSAPKLSTVPLLMQQPNVPLTLLGTAIQSLACPPLLAGSSHNNMQPLALTSPSAFQKLPITPGLPPAVLAPTPRKLIPAYSGSTPDVVNDSRPQDKPISLTTYSSHTVNSDSNGSRMIDRCTSPIPSFECCSNGNITVSTQYDPGDTSNGLLTASVVSSTGNMNPESHILEWITEKRQRIGRNNFITRSRLNFLQKRHKNQFSLKRRELELERRKIALEEKKLILDERKVQLEEEKWQFDKKEREEKLLMMTEEREHKMAMERRQQNMIDILLEFKKKD